MELTIINVFDEMADNCTHYCSLATRKIIWKTSANFVVYNCYIL